MEGWNRWLKRWLPGGGERSEDGDGEKGRRNRLLLILVCLGVLLLLLSRIDGPSPGGGGDGGAPSSVGHSNADGFTSAEERLEHRLEQLLSEIAGVGSVEVLLTFEESERVHYAMQLSEQESASYESDGAGGVWMTQHERSTSHDPVLVRDEQGRGEQPLIEGIEAPIVRGVVVVAAGAADERLRYQLLQAVETALGVPAHRIQILPKAR